MEARPAAESDDVQNQKTRLVHQANSDIAAVDTDPVAKAGSRSWQLLVAIGILWLLLGAALLAYWQRTPASVEITWETATEQGTVGFSLYRSQEREGEYTPINEDEFIESSGSPVSGAKYSYIDEDVNAGETYFYVLEEIEADGSRRRYEDDIFEYQVPGAGDWIILLVLLCAIMGSAMIYAGIREVKNND
jgi:hypothetical protein